MKHQTGIIFVFLVLLLPAWGCEWGIRAGSDEDADATDLPFDGTDATDPLPDGPDTDAGDPDVTIDPDMVPDPDMVDDDAAEPDTPPDTPDVVEDEVSPLCGNGSLDGSEECETVKKDPLDPTDWRLPARR